MIKIYFSMIITMILLTSCSQHSETLHVASNNESHIESKEFQGFKDASESPNDFYVENGRVQTSEKRKRSTTTIEKIPNFQAHEFKSINKNNRKRIKKDLQVSGGRVKVNVESIPLNEFVDFIFSSVLKMNYTVDKDVKKMVQPITLNMASPLAKKQVLAVVENILKQESVLLKQEDGTLFLSQSTKGKVLDGLADRYMVLGRRLSPSLKDNQKVLVFAPFYYTKPQKLFNFARRLKIDKVKISYLNENIAVLDGEAFDVRQLLELINLMDSPSLDKKTPYILELEYISVEKFVERMKSILESNSIPVAENIREVGMVLTPIEEINSVLVLSSKDSWIEMLTFWKNKLDVVSELDSENSQLYIYKVKNRKADELADVLQDVLIINNTNTSSSSNGQNLASSSDSNQSTSSGVGQRKSVNIKSDLYTNSIMMNMSALEYKKILPIIHQLDTLPLQVSVEVTLAEVTMTDSFSLGFEWALLNNKAITGTSTLVSGAHTLAFGGAGISSSLFTENLTSAINAFAEEKQLDILSRPRLVILNNETGNINVGQQVPVVSSEASAPDLVSATPSILRNITYITTGMTLGLTPTINSNGTLTLEISVELSEAQTNKTSSIDSPLIVNRSLTTSAVMQSGNSILLGGIISHNKSTGEGGVPYLQNLPLIGNLFKSQSKSHVKTELIILIKPKILKNSQELHNETENFKKMLKTLRYIMNN